jgi:nucleoside-diphosphate-sugar epimerase
MRILVTGGLGTVGAGLIAELRKRGHHVVSCAAEFGRWNGEDFYETL